MVGVLSGPHLAENLAALGDSAPTLAERLKEVDASHLSLGADGRVFYKRSMTAFAVSLPEAQVEGAWPSAETRLVLFGVGLGEILAQALALLPARRILAWERDPALLVAALGRVPVAEALRAGRLQLLLGADLLDVLPFAKDDAVGLHPVLGALYEEERALLSRLLTLPWAIVCEGTLFVTELTLELRRRGYNVYPLHAGRLSRGEIVRTLQRVKPEFVAAINYALPLAELCAAEGMPLLCWEIDPAVHPETPLAGNPDRIFAFTYRRGYEAELRRAGLRHVEYLPLAADPEVRKPVTLSTAQRAHYAAQVSFVGSSLRGDVPRWEALFVKAFCAQGQSDTEARRVLRAVLAAQAQDYARDRVAELLAPACAGFSESGRGRLRRCAVEIAAAQRRIAYAGALADFELQLWGDAGWSAVPGTRFRGSAGSYTDLNAIYCASAINLDIGRLHQLDIVTMRVFDVLACGGFVLAEHSADLEELFAIGTEVDCYRSLAELREKMAFYLAYPEAARAVAEAGRRAVLTRHTIGQRVGHMLEVAQGRLQRGVPSP